MLTCLRPHNGSDRLTCSAICSPIDSCFVRCVAQCIAFYLARERSGPRIDNGEEMELTATSTQKIIGLAGAIAGKVRAYAAAWCAGSGCAALHCASSPFFSIQGMGARAAHLLAPLAFAVGARAQAHAFGRSRARGSDQCSARHWQRTPLS